jgi:hypothetical protein
VRVKRLMEFASSWWYLHGLPQGEQQTKPHHMQIFHTRVRRIPPKIRQQQHLCWSHCLYCSILQKCITGSKIVSFSHFLPDLSLSLPFFSFSPRHLQQLHAT